MPSSQKTWLITGVSSGLGRALAGAVIAHGDFVIGTFRDAAQADRFTNRHQPDALGVVLDVTDAAGAEKVFARLPHDIGRLDVLVNNAGYGLAGAVEETSEAEARALFEANVFGPLRLTQLALPLMRAQGRGHIVQISSHGGFKAFAGFGLYNASKFALEGFSEALAQEVGPLGIRLTVVQPGPFRTGFAGGSFRLAAAQLAAYDGTAGAFRQRMGTVNGQQEGDPAKAAQAILDVVNSDNPPLRLPLGKVALGTIQAKLDSVQADLNAGREVAAGAVF
ncbi:oxidoreductase [Hymenobacter terricola]|uniref:oxidoreductase n=1 Tax=Hymenobacter terricola TaxID=2819236 RepID=UPI001B3088AC|nr:oxidoreductase [Hymenobacter terricola]